MPWTAGKSRAAAAAATLCTGTLCANSHMTPCQALPDATPCAKCPCTFASDASEKNTTKSNNQMGTRSGSAAAAGAAAGEEEEEDADEEEARAMPTPRLATLYTTCPPPRDASTLRE